jgi:hypothetical protein
VIEDGSSAEKSATDNDESDQSEPSDKDEGDTKIPVEEIEIIDDKDVGPIDLLSVLREMGLIQNENNKTVAGIFMRAKQVPLFENPHV